eukprot:TRINITY_DN1433_c1_g1_i1.p1 TRINITY_DN1433_c1_g1~~TRINITY_DN1433_c1_g1_i1.p1  ORF type:complete len:512 (-),score=87.25 TRINITY_DN1433_c1_g1_i1:158-1660(-)
MAGPDLARKLSQGSEDTANLEQRTRRSCSSGSGSFDHVFTPKHAGVVDDYYTLEDVLGEGSFGTIFRGRTKASRVGFDAGDSPEAGQQLRAIKTISADVTTDRFQSEVNVQKQLDHPNVARLYEVFQDKLKYYLILELCTGGELFDKVVAAGGYFGESTCAIYMRQLLAAVNYLHKHKVAHRDIKPENLLLHSKDDDSPLKLVDFGCSRTFTNGEMMTTFVGTPLYVAPQVLRREYDEKCDIWSCGVIMFVLLSGSAPFLGASEEDLLKAIQIGKYDVDDDDWDEVSESAKELISRMLTLDAQKRHKADSLLDHGWLSSDSGKKANPLPDGLIPRLRTFMALSQFKKIALSLAAQLASDDDIKELRNTFLSFDKNKDGTLTHAEIKEGLEVHGVSLPADIVDILNKIDTDGSGSVGYTEFIASTLSRKEYLREEVLWNVFRTFDLDGDGKITREEFEQVVHLSDREDIAAIFKETDLSGDDQIDFMEFCTMMREAAACGD